MKIGINSRIYQNEGTGIPYFIECLYKEILNLDKKNNYIFYQTNKKKKIGTTEIVKTSKNQLGAFLFDNFTVNKLIGKEKKEIFHGPSNILPFFKKKNVRYALTVHDLSFLVFPNNYPKIFKLYYKYFVGRSLSNADIIIADSKNTKKDIVKFYKIDKKKIKVIYLGVDNIFFNFKIKKRLIENKYFFSISTHPKRKNILSILDVMKKNKNLLNYTYIIAGLIPDSQLKELKEKIQNLGLKRNVVLFGYATKDDLISLYQNAEFFIYPSFYEGFGLPVLEAMACKCPVITSNNSSLVEVMPNKEWLVDPFNLDDISKKITKILELKISGRQQLKNDNYNFAKKFMWKKTAEEYIKVFNGLY